MEAVVADFILVRNGARVLLTIRSGHALQGTSKTGDLLIDLLGKKKCEFSFLFIIGLKTVARHFSCG